MALTGALAVLCGLLTVWAKSAPSRALVSFWWFVLVIVTCMVVVDMPVHADDGLPGIVYIPTVGVVVLRLLTRLRLTARYGLGVLALLIPSGVIYQDWTQVGALVGVVVVAVTVANTNNNDLQTLSHILRDGTTRLNDANAEAQRNR